MILKYSNDLVICSGFPPTTTERILVMKYWNTYEELDFETYSTNYFISKIGKKKKPQKTKNVDFSGFFASMRGFEPPTYRLGGGRSILLSYMDI